MEFLANIHPVIIHFPIAFFVAYFFLEVASLIAKKESLCKMGLSEYRIVGNTFITNMIKEYALKA